MKKKRATAEDKDVPVAKRSKSSPTVKLSPTIPKVVQVAVSDSKTPNEAKPLPMFNLKPAHLDPTRVIPANLGFDFQQAKRHLIGVDPRFGKVFETLACSPFEDLESVDPFRSLCTSIIGQQVSWVAARAINHKFRRLFDRGLPEKVNTGSGAGGDSGGGAGGGEGEGGLDGEKNSFPAPEDVLRLSVEQLRMAGLSGRKAEYEHFRSGQLSTEFLATASVEEVSKALIGVRGIGQCWQKVNAFTERVSNAFISYPRAFMNLNAYVTAFAFTER
ncbi:hypothetical protein HD553DRAFT_323736 [Filobasidium floriforme]|uniref:uncharacterized protein n=1 Tax=Filobasidium floriforme TaxID=5210 RepID=UPI001E8EE568|nr:uncharacterized protein HD553DRAFT_323736 [Filobasidium floriforme]KAH8085157.1 hypothetical protein HD553DRAFT_323736 [Filobasidium floriforme]